MMLTKYLCKVKKGKFKGIEGYTFDYPVYPHSLKVSIWGNDGNEYWVNTENVEFIGREELEFTEQEIQEAYNEIVKRKKKSEEEE